MKRLIKYIRSLFVIDTTDLTPEEKDELILAQHLWDATFNNFDIN